MLPNQILNRSHNKIFRLALCIVFCIGILASSQSVMAITTSDFVDKAQDWFDARDNGSYTATIKCYDISSGEVEIGSAYIYWKDDITDGWSSRIDAVVACPNDPNTIIHKTIVTPDGNEEFLGDTLVYLLNDDATNSSFIDLPHSSLGKAFYSGDPNQTSLQALEYVAISTSASETTLDSISAYKLEVYYDLDKVNEYWYDPDNFGFLGRDIPTDSLESISYIKASDGTPMQTDITLVHDSSTYQARIKWIAVNTSPSLDENTFDLDGGNPNISYEEALENWAEYNCN